MVRLERAQADRADLQEELKVVSDKSLSAEERAQRMDALLKDEESRIYEVEKQLERLRETQVKSTTPPYPTPLNRIFASAPVAPAYKWTETSFL